MSFAVTRGRAHAQRVVEAPKVRWRVEHVGSVETLVTHSASMIHGDCSAEHLEGIGVREGLIRLFVGLEEPKVILAHLRQAIAVANANDIDTTCANEEVLECHALV